MSLEVYFEKFDRQQTEVEKELLDVCKVDLLSAEILLGGEDKCSIFVT